MDDGLSRGRGALMLASIFILGMASGGALFYLGQRSAAPGGFGAGPGLHPASPVEHLSRQLDLDESQREQVGELLEDLRRRMDHAMEECHGEIRSLLRPEQQEIFDQFPFRHHHHPGDSPRHPPGDRQ